VVSATQASRSMTNQELEFAYRSSLLQRRPDLVVVRAVFQMQPGGDAQQLKDRISEILATRAGKHPLSQPSAGSFFKNTRGLPAAGVLIEQAGLKGLRVGGAMVSDMHANFIVNAGGATCADILELMALVQDKVSQTHGVRLEPEVRIIS
jgi:UDP-N-acetylmuramate dehydrogenase